MALFVATLPAGCYPIIAKELKRKFSVEQFNIVSYDESSVCFRADLNIEKLIELRFFTNVFMVVDEPDLASCRPYIKGRDFRLFGLENGKPRLMDISEKRRLEAAISQTLGLHPNAKNYSNDFVLLRHKSLPKATLTLRLPRAKHKRQARPAGSLRPELAHILLLVAGVRPKDTLLDPFAGYGAIPLEAVRGFGLRHVQAIDKIVHKNGAAEYKIQQGDAMNLKVASGSIDKIVTDPPWGLYDATVGGALYPQTTHEMARALKSSGILVVLSGNVLLDQALKATPQLTLLKEYSILVSGKKARILKFQKI